ncbi:4-hydroxyphenylacetate decarboxylase activase [Anaeromicrobium sediminis]|uniref:Glycyl-radical enzyme activating protein n=1 Tax=Anaeromicrobium sediminis TaxID=1478221 RepID=A0A267MEF9_9FIRM|nr:4-hydroxyphenylacetate decarboxylase activase [Anaeromicrobium sediminis]PAB57847.1 glycyl-radical enzyme activating protein [Anaeromicrobium sediminis]
MSAKGLLFDIQSYSVHDGPGCRTLFFLSGCPLHCEWCANPESWRLCEKVMFASSKCKVSKGCSRCIDKCPHDSITIKENKLVLNWDLCRKCTTFSCTKACFYEALKLCGKYYEVDELLKIMDRDRQYWGENGGVTFSGGEPFVQHDFLLKILKKCRDRYIHTAIETTGYVDNSIFLNVMNYVDFAFIDVKHMDKNKHKEKTGVYNDRILENIRSLKESKWPGRLVLRMPVIKDFNDTQDNINHMVSFMKELDLFEINILPFHRMGDSKWTQLGYEYKYKNEEPTSHDKLEKIQTIFLDNDIACYIGHETPF